MHTPAHYKEKDPQELRRFVKQYAFSQLTSVHEGRPIMTHLPLLLEHDEQGREVLVGHLSRANPQWKSILGQPLLAVFTGPHCYISSGWYEKPNAPTWNYQTVHVYGEAEYLDSEQTLASLDRLVDKYERDREEPVVMEELPDTVIRQVRGVVGIRIYPTEWQATYKLSQNRHANDFQQIISKLRERNYPGDNGVADAMERIGNKK